MEVLNISAPSENQKNVSSYKKLSDFFYQISRKKKRHVSDEKLLAVTLMAHGGSAALAKLALAPLDRVKLLLQIQPNLTGVESRNILRFRSPKDALFGIYRTQGLRSFWWGFGPHTLNVFQSTAIRLTAYQRFRMLFFPDAGREQKYSGLSLYCRKVGCFFASTTATLLISYPLDVAYTRMAADTGLPWNSTEKTYKSSAHCLIRNAVNQGISSVYRGLSLCIVVSFPFICIAQALHDYFEYLILLNICQNQRYKFVKILPSRNDSDPFTKTDEKSSKTYPIALISLNEHTAHSSCFSSMQCPTVHYPPSEPAMRAVTATPLELFPWNLVSGFFAGLVAQTVTYPLDTIRRRYQYDGCYPWTNPPYSRQYTSITDCFQKCLRHGVASLYRGCGINMMKAVPECIVLSGLYYIIKTTLPP